MDRARPGGALGRSRTISREWELVRAVAQADGSVGRIVDGHYNAWSASTLLADEPLRSTHLEEVAAGRRWLGSGAPTRPRRGRARARRAHGDDLRLEGVKTFCSGAGGLHGALVVANDRDARRVAYVDLSEGVEIDRAWFAAVWDCARPRATSSGSVARGSTHCSAAPTSCCATPGSGVMPSAPPRPGPASPTPPAPPRSRRSRPARWPATTSPPWPSAGSTPTRRPSTMWLAEAGPARGTPTRGRDAQPVGAPARGGRAGPRRRSSTRRCAPPGSRPLARGGALDRAARDLRIFLLQHRLDPLLVRAGREAVDR
jgi:hypothetical protein